MTEKTAEKSGKRLDVWLAESEPELSRSRWQRLIKEGCVTVNGTSAKPNQKLHPGDRMEWSVPEPVRVETLPENIPLDVLFEDAHLIALNKPAGLVVHPAAGNESGTLVNALLHHCDDLTGIGGEQRPGIVHRLDKETSGVMVVAKTEAAMNKLARQFKKRETEKEYQAIVRGTPKPPAGRIETTIGRHPVFRKKMAANARRGRHAVSTYHTIEQRGNASLLSVRIETGRTHQIRVHLAFIKHPILGDPLYARRRPTDEVWPDRQMLHATRLSIMHPDADKKMTFQAPLPDDMIACLDTLQKLNHGIHRTHGKERPTNDTNRHRT